MQSRRPIRRSSACCSRCWWARINFCTAISSGFFFLAALFELFFPAFKFPSAIRVADEARAFLFARVAICPATAEELLGGMADDRPPLSTSNGRSTVIRPSISVIQISVKRNDFQLFQLHFSVPPDTCHHDAQPINHRLFVIQRRVWTLAVESPWTSPRFTISMAALITPR